MTRGPLIIVSGPSGSGKSTLIHRVLAERRYPLRLAVSATTRPRRDGGARRRGLSFLDARAFQGTAGGGVPRACPGPWANCTAPCGARWTATASKGIGVILDIDVQGAAQVRPLYPDHVSVFVEFPGGDVRAAPAETRLRDEATIARRLATARRELARKGEYRAHHHQRRPRRQRCESSSP